jgi:Fuc2NAc and GlcNAc transferase
MIGFALVTLVLALLASWWGTGRVRRFAVARAMRDIANEPSSHSGPTPRGGAAIVVVVLAGILVGAAGGWVRDSTAVALVPSGAAVALASRLDDRRGVPRGIRLLVPLAAAAWVVYCFGPMEALVPPGPPWLGRLGPILSVLAITWVANLFNRMDGIDGLTAGEAVTVGLGAMLLCWRVDDLEPTWLAALVMVAAAGFLPWNWHPARILLGDVGSVFLGFIFASLAVLTGQRGDIPAAGWLVLLGVFALDATVTLFRRWARGERGLDVHRSHAYQRAVQAGLTHAQVSGAVMAVNGMLALLVWWAVARPHWAVAAYGAALLLVLALYVRVGRALPM